MIAGLPADKSYYKKIQQLIRELNLQEKVEYIGVLNRKDIPAWLYHAHINFFPSCCETNSVVLAEMLGCGAIIDNQPRLLPMNLKANGRWDGVV